jgi:hypothetical protein
VNKFILRQGVRGFGRTGEGCLGLRLEEKVEMSESEVETGRES